MTTTFDQHKRQDTRLMVVAVIASVVVHGIVLNTSDNQWDFSVDTSDKSHQRITLSFVKNEPEGIPSSSGTATETNRSHDDRENKAEQRSLDFKQKQQVSFKEEPVISENQNSVLASSKTKNPKEAATALLTPKSHAAANTGESNKLAGLKKDKKTANAEKSISTANNTHNANRQSNDTGATSTTDAIEYKKQLLHQINDELRKHIKYPFLARKRGWSGKVTISFEFTDRGTIHNINLFRSSGYPLLDNSALDAFHSIMHIRFINQYNSAHSDTLQVPVEYRLTEG